MSEADSCPLAVIVVTHDSALWLPGFVSSWKTVLASAPPALPTIAPPLILADSGSSDETLRMARELVPDAVILPCGNIGYGAAANRGAAAAPHARWLLICNADLTFPTDFAHLLLEPAINGRAPTDAACIAPQLRNPDGSLQPSIGNFPALGALLRDQLRPRHQRKYVYPQPTQSARVDWATGACLLIRRESFAAIGGFDEKYFLYVEEVDLQKRFRASGFTTWFVPAAKVTHHAPNAARPPRPQVQRWAARGLLRYFAKFGGWCALRGYGKLAVLTGRLSIREAFAARRKILGKATGPD